MRSSIQNMSVEELSRLQQEISKVIRQKEEEQKEQNLQENNRYVGKYYLCAGDRYEKKICKIVSTYEYDACQMIGKTVSLSRENTGFENMSNVPTIRSDVELIRLFKKDDKGQKRVSGDFLEINKKDFSRSFREMIDSLKDSFR